MIDPKKLAEANRAMVDTNVLIFALGGGTRNPSHKIARALVEAFAEKKMRMLVAAPSFAEFELRSNGQELPTGGGLIEVVAFDHDAANLLAKRMPMDALKRLGYAPKGVENGRHCLKYDSMIVACAARHHASCIISTDEEPATPRRRRRSRSRRRRARSSARSPGGCGRKKHPRTPGRERPP